jgi:hypothetical protein
MYNFQSTGFQLSYFCLVRVKKKLPVFFGVECFGRIAKLRQYRETGQKTSRHF